MTQPLIGTGVWSSALRNGDPSEIGAAAGELESLGYGALWIPDVGGDVFAAVENLLAATTTATIATGILNLWMHTAEETAASHARLTAQYGNRFLVGIGISHALLIDSKIEAGAYRQPLARTRAFLDALDAAPVPLAVEDRALAALGPKMLELAATRTAGVHPYLVTPEHTQLARQAVGPDALVATEQGVVLETDPDRARAIARTKSRCAHCPTGAVACSNRPASAQCRFNYRIHPGRKGPNLAAHSRTGDNELLVPDARTDRRRILWPDTESITQRPFCFGHSLHPVLPAHSLPKPPLSRRWLPR